MSPLELLETQVIEYDLPRPIPYTVVSDCAIFEMLGSELGASYILGRYSFTEVVPGLFYYFILFFYMRVCVCIHGFTGQRKILDIIFQALSFVLDRFALWSGRWPRRLDQLAYRDSPALPPISPLLVQKYMPLNPLFYTESGDLKSGHQCL